VSCGAIRATSPGLQPTEISIQFTGTNPYKKGVTPTVNRPYVRFTKKDQPKIPQHFGQNNPAYASSFNTDHPAGFAVDGNKNTWWQPLADDTTVFWKLDTEKRLSLKSISVLFPANEIYCFAIEISENGTDWKVVDDMMNNVQPVNSRHINVDGITCGLVRIRFKHAALAKIAEVDVTGNVID
jgi:hypothetical protein